MLPTLTKNHLIALLKQYKAYPDQHRDNCWRFLLALPCNEDRLDTFVQDYKLYTEKESLNTPNLILQAKNLTFTLDEMYPIANRTLKQRVEKVALALYRWSPSLAQCSWLPKFIFPFVKFYGISTASAFETVCLLLKTYENMFIFRNFMSNRELFIINSMIENFFILKTPQKVQEPVKIANLMHQNNQNHCLKNLKNQQFFIFNVFSTFFTEQLEGKEWLQLVDHFLTQGKVISLYILLAIFTAREMDLNFKLKIDQKSLNLNNINDILRCFYLILANFSPSNCDIYNDLVTISGKITTNFTLDDEFDHKFAEKQLETITMDVLPGKITPPEMKMRDMDAEVQEVEEMFNTKYANNDIKMQVERDRKNDEKLLSQVSGIMESMKSSKTGDGNSGGSQGVEGASGVSSTSQIDKKKISFAVDDDEILEQKQQKINQNTVNENVLQNQMEPPKRYQNDNKNYSKKADQELRADELVNVDRPLTQTEIKRAVARSQVNENARTRQELAEKLELIEQDYAERRQIHPASTSKNVKVEEDDQLQSWIPMASNRIGKSVNETLQNRLKGIRYTNKQQSGLNKGSTSTNVGSSDGVINKDELYQENQDEADIIDDIQLNAPPKPIQKLSDRQIPKKQIDTTTSNIKNAVVQTPKPKSSGTNIKSQEKPKSPKYPQSTAANAFKKQFPDSNTSKNASSSISQPTPSIMKSTSSKNTSQVSAKFPPKQVTKQPIKKTSIATNEDIMPSRQDKELVRKLLQMHQEKISQSSSTSKLTNSLVEDSNQEDLAKSESSLLSNEVSASQSKKDLLKKEKLIQNTIKEIKQAILLDDSIASPQVSAVKRIKQKKDDEKRNHEKSQSIVDEIQNDILKDQDQISSTVSPQQVQPATPTQLKQVTQNQENFDSPAINIIKVVKKKQSQNSSKDVSQNSSTTENYAANQILAPTKISNYLTKQEITELPISNEIKKKLFDLQSQISQSDHSQIEEIANNEQSYKNIMNSQDLNVDQKIQALISEIQHNTLQSVENNQKQKIIDQMSQNIKNDSYDTIPNIYQQQISNIQQQNKQQPTAKNIFSNQNQNQLGSSNSINLGSSDGTLGNIMTPNTVLMSSMSKTTDTTAEARKEIKNMIIDKKLNDGTFGHGLVESESTQELYQQQYDQKHQRGDTEYMNQLQPKDSQLLDLPSPEELILQIGQAPQRSKSVAGNKGLTNKQLDDLKEAGLSDEHIQQLIKQNIYSNDAQNLLQSSQNSNSTDDRLQRKILGEDQNQNFNNRQNLYSGKTENPYQNNQNNGIIENSYDANFPINENTFSNQKQNLNIIEQPFENQSYDKQHFNEQQTDVNQFNNNKSSHQDSLYDQQRQRDTKLPYQQSNLMNQLYPEKSDYTTSTSSGYNPNQQNIQNLAYQQPHLQHHNTAQYTHRPYNELPSPSNTGKSQTTEFTPDQFSQSVDKTNFRSIMRNSPQNELYTHQINDINRKINDDSIISAVPNNVFQSQNRSGSDVGSHFNTGNNDTSNLSESSTSNFSSYLKQLQQQTKTLENRLNSSAKSTFLYNSARVPKPVAKPPSDASVFSNATSTISTVDTDPDSFNESFQVATNAAKELREESQGIQNGLKGLFNEVQKGLQELESQISSSVD
eukprot:EST41986.1 hypothetical protein SS50377_18291 [Spironucleus salmonicida]